MEATFRTQIDRVLAAIEVLVSHNLHHPLLKHLMSCKGGHLEQITACSKQLEEFDELAREALENRKLRHEEWETWKLKPSPSTGVRLWSKARNEQVPTETTMVTAYTLAGQRRVSFLRLVIHSNPSKDKAVRQYVSKAEVARCPFKDRVMAQVDVPFFTPIVYNLPTLSRPFL